MVSDTCVFYTDEKKAERLLRLFPGCEKRRLYGDDEKEPFRGQERRNIIIAAANEELQGLTALCRGQEFASVRVYPFDSGYLPSQPIPIDASKPRLDYLETEICHSCNLNCRACTNFSNLRQKTGFYDVDRFEKDLRRLKELFWGVTKIRLMGGEPLINPRVADYAALCREIFPDCDLRIVSNGLLLPKIKQETIERIRDCGGSFDISNYPPTQAKRKEIAAAAAQAGVGISFGVPIRFFFKFLRETPGGDPGEAFRNCMFTHCHMLEDGVLAACENALCIDRFNAFYGARFPQTDRFDLSDPTLDGWEILDRFSKPHEFCSCCGSGMVPTVWKGHVGPDRAKKEDWLIRDCFLTGRLLPAVHKMLKPAAMKLRAATRKK